MFGFRIPLGGCGVLVLEFLYFVSGIPRVSKCLKAVRLVIDNVLLPRNILHNQILLQYFFRASTVIFSQLTKIGEQYSLVVLGGKI